MRIRKVFMVTNVLMIMLIGINCGSNKEASDKEKRSDKFTMDYLTKGKKEVIALLSIKYSIEENVVEGIIDEYNETHNWLLKIVKNKKIAESVPEINLNFKKTIVYLGEKYSIPKEKVASMILDYKGWGGRELEENEFTKMASEIKE